MAGLVPGAMRRALGTALAGLDHDVTFAVRNPNDPRYAGIGTVAAVADAATGAACS